MEDRKRPAISAADDIAPPSKRQAINGAAKSRDDGDMREEAWIEEFQKDAMYRQMLEYKRQISTLESQLAEIQKRSTYHDDHLRVVDQWWLQLLQEIELAAGDTVSVDPHANDASSLSSSALQFKDSQTFQEHLRDKGKTIKAKVESLLSRLGPGREINPEAAALESQLKHFLAQQKDLAVKLDRTNAEKETLSEQLDTATLRYVKAEKKLDRAKSAQVQKLEQRALAVATTRPSAAEHATDDSSANGNNEALQLKYDEATAVLAKQKEQIAAAFSDLKSLQEENSTLKARKEVTTDEDYARTELFRQFKVQSEDLIKRVNHLEAVNKTLREEIEKLQAERLAYREQLHKEAQHTTAELEEQLQLKEQDLTRIRAVRDELSASVAVHKAGQDQERTSLDHMKELVNAKDDRIAGLELELERLRPSEDAPTSSRRDDLDSLPSSELILEYVKMEKDYELIKSEVPSVEKAYKKAMALSQKKIMDLGLMESRITNLTAEKIKAEQKYFAARRDMDMRQNETRALRLQNNKSSDIISQLKDVETQTRSLVANLEKQLAEMRQANVSVMEENRKLKSTSADALRQHDTLKNQATNLGNLVKTKDSAAHVNREKAAAVEVELEKVKARLEHVQSERDTWKSKTLTGTSDSEENLRKFALCNVCNSHFKNAVLKTCGHVFCHECIDNRVTNRRRKCPSCGKAFDKLDVMQIHM